jgi:beta-1,4-mannosyltransferase
MLNHALAMAENGIEVALVGYVESELDASIAGSAGIRIHPIRTFARCPESYPRPVFLIWTALRLFWAQLQALWTLFLATPRPGVILAQNPPTFPTVSVARLAARLRGSRFVVDWHNFGYSMLALRLGEKSGLVRLLRRYEAGSGRLADGHLCVSRAMAERLKTEAGIRGARPLHDLPLRLERPLCRAEREQVLRSLFPDARLDAATLTLHCPTSWTDDEDTDMLLEAVLLAEQQGGSPLFVVATGLGPRRGAFERRLAGTSLRRSQVRTAFLAPADYRRLLAAADCGVSLHRSASGVDLPMKLVDFFGAGTPALALDYGACLRERIQDGREALFFHDAAGLARRILEVQDADRLEALRASVRPAWNETWEEAWRREALPALGFRGGFETAKK